jgi:four helix bundle protein
MEALRRLEVWRRASVLAVDTYRLLAICRNRVFREQLSGSVLSIASNIAEGYGRQSRKERIQFLRVAKASGNEAWTQFLIGTEADLVPRLEGEKLAAETVEVVKMISGLIRYLDRRSQP